MYACLELIFARFVPLFNRVLTELANFVPNRIEVDPYGWYDDAALWKSPWPTRPMAKLPASSETETEQAAAGGTHCWNAVAVETAF